MPHELAVLTPLGPAHEVVGGDSYWQIADDHLTAVLHRDATPPEVLEYTEALVSFNHPLLGHRDPALIVPGELVVFTPSGDAPVLGDSAPTARVTDAPVDAPADAPAELPAEMTPATPHERALPEVRPVPLRVVPVPATRSPSSTPLPARAVRSRRARTARTA